MYLIGYVNAHFLFLACPLSLGLGDGRIRDEQLSASSELDDNHAAKQGRVVLVSSSHDRYWHHVENVPWVDLLSLIVTNAGQRKNS